MVCPSGLHTGLVSLAGSAVRRTGAPAVPGIDGPDVGATPVRVAVERADRERQPRVGARAGELGQPVHRDEILHGEAGRRRQGGRPGGDHEGNDQAASHASYLLGDGPRCRTADCTATVQYARRFRSGGRVRSMTDGRDIRGGGRGHRAAAVPAGRSDGRGGLRRRADGRTRAGRRRPPVEAVTLGNAPVERTERVHRHRQVAPVDDDPAAGRRHHPADRGRVGRPRDARHGAARDRRRAAAGLGGDAAVAARRATRRPRSGQAAGRARQDAARRRRRLTAGIRPGARPRSPRRRRSSRRSTSRSGSSGSSSATTA